MFCTMSAFKFGVWTIRVEMTYQVPVHYAHHKAPTHDVAKERRDHALPDVKANGDLRIAEENGHGHEEPISRVSLAYRRLDSQRMDCRRRLHVGDNVVESKTNKRKGWPPDSHDLAEIFPG